jgi:predicted nucleotidyltransferase
MRLSAAEVAYIKATIVECFGARSRVLLFGSRADDAKRGGDIDLYVEPEVSGDISRLARECRVRLTGHLPYPVDLILATPGRLRPVDKIARLTGVEL